MASRPTLKDVISWLGRYIFKVVSILILLLAFALMLRNWYVSQKDHRMVGSIPGWGGWNWTSIKVDRHSELYAMWKEIQGKKPVPPLKSRQRVTSLHTMKERLQRVSDVCHHYRLDEKETLWYIHSNKDEDMSEACSTDRCSVIVDESTDYFFCFIPKVASTLFKHFFMTLIDINVSSNYLGFHSDANFFLKRVSPSYYTQTHLNKYIYKKVMFVRDPFERLASVYWSKLMTPRGRSVVIDGRELTDFYYVYSVPIMRRYRGSYFKEAQRPPLTFNEFVDYLIETPPIYYDTHWVPYWIRCEPCRIKYDYVGKIETMETDAKYAFDYELAPRRNRSTVQEKKTVELFQQVTRNNRLLLYQIYRLDFEMFGYSVEKYL